ncbi:MAG: hypothetical protein QM610_03545 [Chitinophagaceae bacterium]
MKQILTTIMAIMLFAGTSFAQTVKTTTTKAKATTEHVKKDGTPDKRYKENKKAAADSVKHLKKDGTPDKRYKENKKSTVKKAS